MAEKKEDKDLKDRLSGGEEDVEEVESTPPMDKFTELESRFIRFSGEVSHKFKEVDKTLASLASNAGGVAGDAGFSETIKLEVVEGNVDTVPGILKLLIKRDENEWEALHMGAINSKELVRKLQAIEGLLYKKSND